MENLDPIPNFVQVLPVLHFAWIGVEFGKIPSQEHLSVSNLRAFFLYPFIRIFFVPAVPCTENSCRDIVHQQLLVDHIHDCRDDLLDVFLPIY